MKAHHTGVWLYVPRTFNPRKFIELSGLENEACWLLHKIVTVAVARRHAEDGPANVSRATMEQFIAPRHVSTVREALLKGGVIVTDGVWVPKRSDPKGKGKSLGYCLSDGYADSGLRRVEVTKKALAAKILAHRLKYKDRPVAEADLPNVQQYLLGWLKRTRIDIDRAFDIIDAMPERKREVVLGKKGRQRIVTFCANAINKMTASTIYNGEWEFITCPFGRVHTNVTRLLSELRACLSIGGRPLVSLDIRNSQIVFFSLLLMEHCYAQLGEEPSFETGDRPQSKLGSRTEMITEGDQSDENDQRLIHREEAVGEKIGSGPHTPRANILPHDVLRFISMTMEGIIYDFLMEKTKIVSRKEFKQLFFKDVLYGDSNAYYSRTSPLNQFFREEFPTIHQFISDSKRGDEKKAYAKLAQNMQRRESRFMINSVVQRLMCHHADIPCLTIHDSVLTTPEHVETVHRVITEEFARLGIHPSVKIEDATEQPVVQHEMRIRSKAA